MIRRMSKGHPTQRMQRRATLAHTAQAILDELRERAASAPAIAKSAIASAARLLNGDQR
jgi:hypothetical protein